MKGRDEERVQNLREMKKSSSNFAIRKLEKIFNGQQRFSIQHLYDRRILTKPNQK